MMEMEKEKADALSALYLENHDQLLKVASREFWIGSLAEDVVQDTFCEAIRCWDKVSSSGNPGGWLMEALKLKIMHKRWCRIHHTQEDVRECAMEVEFWDDNYDRVETNLLLEQILEPEDRELFCLMYRCGYSTRDLAQLRDCSEGNMRVKLYRIRKRLQKYIDHVGIEL